MAYTPHEWETGDVITATKLNELEQAVAGGGGYDAEVSIYFGQGSSDPMVGTIIKGDYATLLSMLNEKKAPNVLVRIWNDATHYAAASDAVYVYSFNEEKIVFNVYLPVSGAGSFYTFVWDSSDVLTAY